MIISLGALFGVSFILFASYLANLTFYKQFPKTFIQPIVMVYFFVEIAAFLKLL
jgi:hypothetical protein